MKKILMLSVSLSALLLAACDPELPSSTKRESLAQEQLANQAAVAVGLPAINNFTEKRQLKAIYELRDQSNLVTYTYTIDLQGKRHKVCPTTSVGFGIPYATQFTNPQRVIQSNVNSASMVTMPQADPNALFSPPQADGTWVICTNPKTQELSPAYVEPHIVVYTFEMPSIGE